MSRVNKNSIAKQEETEVTAEDFSVGVNDSQVASTHARRVVITCSATAQELMEGKTVANSIPRCVRC